MEIYRKYKFKGCNDDHDTCDCCGKTGLKKVVWLAEIDQDGEELSIPAPYGTTCAGRLLGYIGTRQTLTTRFKNMEEDKLRVERQALMNKISAKRAEIAEKHGLVLFEGDWLFPEDAPKVRGLIGGPRITLLKRPEKEIHPIFAVFFNPETMVQYL